MSQIKEDKPLLIVRQGQDLFALSIQPIVRMDRWTLTELKEKSRVSQKTAFLEENGHLIPLIALHGLFSLPEEKVERVLLIRMEVEQQEFVLVVDGVVGIEMVPVYSLGKLLEKSPFLGGVAKRSNAQGILVLDPKALVKHASTHVPSEAKGKVSSDTGLDISERFAILESEPGEQVAVCVSQIESVVRVEWKELQQVGGVNAFSLEDRVVSVFTVSNTIMEKPPRPHTNVVVTKESGGKIGFCFNRLLTTVEIPGVRAEDLEDQALMKWKGGNVASYFDVNGNLKRIQKWLKTPDSRAESESGAEQREAA